MAQQRLADPKPARQKATWRQQVLCLTAGPIKVTVMRTARVWYLIQWWKDGKLQWDNYTEKGEPGAQVQALALFARATKLKSFVLFHAAKEQSK